MSRLVTKNDYPGNPKGSGGILDGVLTPFWRNEPFTGNERELLEALFEGHHQAAFRENISTQVLKAAFMGNGHNFNGAVAAAASTLGGLHAPIIQAYEILQEEVYPLPAMIKRGEKLSGFGNSFIKEIHDPIWHGVDYLLLRHFKKIHSKIWEIVKLLHAEGKMIFPNAASYSASTAIVIGMPKRLAPSLVYIGRLWAWTQLLYDIERQASEV